MNRARVLRLAFGCAIMLVRGRLVDDHPHSSSRVRDLPPPPQTLNERFGAAEVAAELLVTAMAPSTDSATAALRVEIVPIEVLLGEVLPGDVVVLPSDGALTPDSDFGAPDLDVGMTFFAFLRRSLASDAELVGAFAPSASYFIAVSDAEGNLLLSDGEGHLATAWRCDASP